MQDASLLGGWQWATAELEAGDVTSIPGTWHSWHCIPRSSSCPVFCRKHHLYGAASVQFPCLVFLSCSSCSLLLPWLCPSPTRIPLQLHPHTPPRFGLLFPPGASFKSAIDVVRHSYEEILSPAARCRWGPRLNPRPVLHWGITMNSSTVERWRKSSSVLQETALSSGPK